ncbi:hypothetical protein MJO28_016979 [Puccinia striiformis f. sp. tritici]|nr:hypothetical protein MJO28_016979 [Puccinia striiformis f. sp. tritici]
MGSLLIIIEEKIETIRIPSLSQPKLRSARIFELSPKQRSIPFHRHHSIWIRRFTTHDINLLKKASSATSSKQPLQSDKNALLQLESSLQRLHRKTGNHHSTLEDALNRLDRYPAAAELSRRTSQFVTLAKQTTRSSDGRTR